MIFTLNGDVAFLFVLDRVFSPFRIGTAKLIFGFLSFLELLKNLHTFSYSIGLHSSNSLSFFLHHYTHSSCSIMNFFSLSLPMTTTHTLDPLYLLYSILHYYIQSYFSYTIFLNCLIFLNIIPYLCLNQSLFFLK